MTEHGESLRYRLVSMTLALLTGAAGSSLFYLLRLPLPWMLGAMLATLLASAGGAPVRSPTVLRPAMVTVIGVMLGASFTAETLSNAASWWLPLLGLVGFLTTSAICCAGYFYRVAGYDRATAYFSGMPGGLVEMVLLGDSAGADTRTISLIHAARIVLVVLTLPFVVSFFGGALVRGGGGGSSFGTAPLSSWAWLFLASILGALLGRLLRLPARDLIGPMLVSAALHVAGATHFVPPAEMVAVAQVIIGTTLGSRFAGIQAQEIGKVLLHAGGSVLILLCLTLVFSFGIASLADMSPVHLILAYSPGGIAEMGLVALALNLDVAMVIFHHIARVLLVTVGAQLFLKPQYKSS
jgi:membrane AbrB-like protein